MHETSVASPVAESLSACPVCGSQALERCAVPTTWIGESVFGPHRGAFGVTACGGCGFEFVNPRPSPALLGAFYGGTEYDCHDPDATDTTDARADHLVAFVGSHVRGRRMLDYGCGAGVVLRSAVHAGWEAIGYDVGAAAVAGCRRQGLEAVGDLASLEPASFDAIVLSHVFEHVPDHRQTLEVVRGLLAPGGRLFVECPNVRSMRARLSRPVFSRYLRFDERYRAFPIHLSYFSPRTLARVLEDAGFAVEVTTTWGFGIEELVVRRDTHEAPTVGPETARGGEKRRSPARRIAKSVLSRLILDTGLGENVVAVARARGRT